MCISDLQIYNRHYGQRVAYLIRHCILFLKYRNRFLDFIFIWSTVVALLKKNKTKFDAVKKLLRQMVKKNLLKLLKQHNIKTEQDC